MQHTEITNKSQTKQKRNKDQPNHQTGLKSKAQDTKQNWTFDESAAEFILGLCYVWPDYTYNMWRRLIKATGNIPAP